MSAVCPACGVPVVPGYVRCPKCHAALPRVTFRRGGVTIDPGGTAVGGPTPKKSIVGIAVAGIAAIALVAYLGLRGGKTETRTVEAAAPEHKTETATGVPNPVAPPPRAGSAVAAPDAATLAANLERALKRQRLWSTVEVIGDHVDIRSGSCSDHAMAAAIDGVTGSFKTAGLAKLRCLEQSGHVVFVRTF